MKSTMTLQVPTDTLHEGKSVSPNQFAQSFARTTRNAWADLYIRRPEDKQFKSASRLRQELAEATTRPTAAAPVVTPALPDANVLALIAALQTQTQTNVPVPAPAQATSIPPRDTTPGEGWTLPERRKYRYRLEDVAY